MSFDYDLFVIGGGSGGVRAGGLLLRWASASALPRNTAMVAPVLFAACVPKKLLVYASSFAENFKDAAGFGWSVGETRFDWPTLIANKDREIARLKASIARGWIGPMRIFLTPVQCWKSRMKSVWSLINRIVTAKKILVAVGGTPSRQSELPGHELCITSDEIFHLEELPKSIVIAGGGYVAVEFAGVMAGLGVDTTLVYRGPEILRTF